MNCEQHKANGKTQQLIAGKKRPFAEKGLVMKKILIADDSLFMREMLKSILHKGLASKASENGHEIIEADSGVTALAQFKKEKPDLVLLDIIMPGGEAEGINVLGKIMKADPEAQVVMVTAVGQDAIVEECKKLGAKDYIVKPFDEKTVVGTVEKYLP